MNANELRAQATKLDQNAHESFERCDTDGYLSQWAAGICAQEARLQADILEDGGKAMFFGLFDLEGNLVPAKFIETQYGWAWGILADSNPRSRFVKFFNPSKAKNQTTARKNDAKKGYYVGYVMAPAKATLKGHNRTSVSAVAVRTDDGFSVDAEIVDNGHQCPEGFRTYYTEC